jgi:hypothetical protein
LVRSTISVGSDQDVDEDFSYFWDFDCESWWIVVTILIVVYQVSL